MENTKFKIGDKAYKPKGYNFPCTIVSVFKTVGGSARLVAEMDDYGLLHIFNEEQLEPISNYVKNEEDRRIPGVSC
jgi:hypothetical protein